MAEVQEEALTEEELYTFTASTVALAADFYLALHTVISPRLNPGGPKDALAMLAALETACLNLRLCIQDSGLPSLGPEDTHRTIELVSLELRRRREAS